MSRKTQYNAERGGELTAQPVVVPPVSGGEGKPNIENAAGGGGKTKRAVGSIDGTPDFERQLELPLGLAEHSAENYWATAKARAEEKQVKGTEGEQ